jgi:hypothetical protein
MHEPTNERQLQEVSLGPIFSRVFSLVFGVTENEAKSY